MEGCLLFDKFYEWASLDSDDSFANFGASARRRAASASTSASVEAANSPPSAKKRRLLESDDDDLVNDKPALQMSKWNHKARRLELSDEEECEFINIPPSNSEVPQKEVSGDKQIVENTSIEKPFTEKPEQDGDDVQKNEGAEDEGTGNERLEKEGEATVCYFCGLGSLSTAQLFMHQRPGACGTAEIKAEFHHPHSRPQHLQKETDQDVIVDDMELGRKIVRADQQSDSVKVTTCIIDGSSDDDEEVDDDDEEVQYISMSSADVARRRQLARRLSQQFNPPLATMIYDAITSAEKGMGAMTTLFLTAKNLTVIAHEVLLSAGWDQTYLAKHLNLSSVPRADVSISTLQGRHLTSSTFQKCPPLSSATLNSLFPSLDEMYEEANHFLQVNGKEPIMQLQLEDGMEPSDSKQATSSFAPMRRHLLGRLTQSELPQELPTLDTRILGNVVLRDYRHNPV